MFKQKTKYPLTLDIQFFAEGVEGGGEGGAGEGAQGGQGVTAPIFTPEQQAQIDAMLKSAQDQIRNDYGKKTKDLQTTIDQLKNQGKSKEQLAQEAEDKLIQGQRELLSQKNMFHAVQQLTKEGLDSELLDLVIVNEGDDEEARNAATDERIKTVSDIVNRLVTKKVEEKIKGAGYNPGNGNVGGGSQSVSLMETILNKQIKK
ncbi:hypothetical protein A6395_13295 [Exiguobacterium sp. SH31]|uniref:capsid assembly scaffolding protein Gp46 family protein n=1 Tax=Exiguobacterium sp. SH31 TaxID=1843183 RepID=UPI0008D7E441|nr:DUF4355 domain-containing protein [Exiguobacterium sp. SH31]OGX78191.1 hypothetical protein A6395_13295 [Exiguobacterium sp. SH31]